MNCPICLDFKNSYVKLECSHSVCLKCYHTCIYSNLVKCPLCRVEIKEVGELCNHIKNMEVDIEELEKDYDKHTAEIDELKEELSSKEQELEEAESLRCELEERIAHNEY